MRHSERLLCYCYILECSDGSFYTGWTTDPEARGSRPTMPGAARAIPEHGGLCGWSILNPRLTEAAR